MKNSTFKKVVNLTLVMVLMISIAFVSSYNGQISYGLSGVSGLPEKKGIIVIPGFMGTQLYNANTNERIWPLGGLITNLIDENGNEKDTSDWDLWMNVGGRPSEVRAKYENDIKNRFTWLRFENGRSYLPVKLEPNYSSDGRYGVYNTYGKMVNTLKNNFPQADVSFFGWDWRDRLELAADKLEAFIKQKGYTEITIVAHSLGTLVASDYLSRSEANRIKLKAIYSLGSPLLGTINSLRAIHTGINFNKPEFDMLLLGQIQKYASGFPASYYAFPTKKYFDFVGNYIAVGRKIDKYYISGGYDRLPPFQRDRFLNYDQSIDLLKKQSWMNITHLNAAINFHNRVTDVSKHVLHTVNSHFYVGTGHKTPINLNYVDTYEHRAYYTSYSYYPPNVTTYNPPVFFDRVGVVSILDPLRPGGISYTTQADGLTHPMSGSCGLPLNDKRVVTGNWEHQAMVKSDDVLASIVEKIK